MPIIFAQFSILDTGGILTGIEVDEQIQINEMSTPINNLQLLMCTRIVFQVNTWRHSR